MRQVLFYIPVQADWLPDFFPLPALVFVCFLLLAAAAWFVGPRQVFKLPEETWKNIAKWLVGLGAAVGVGLFVAGRYLPAGVPVNGFGMMLFVAFLLCNWVAGRLAVGSRFLNVATGPDRGKDYLATRFPAEERDRRTQDMIQDTSIVLFIGGILGARVTYLLKENPPASVWDFIVQLPMIWEGGIIFYGSVIGGTIAFAGWYAYKYVYANYRIDALKLADIAAPCLALGLCLGRIGCLLNGCCYGQVACAECAVVPVHFPLSAPSRYALVHDGYQTAAGFTLTDASRFRGGEAVVGKVAPGSAAAVAGLRDGDRIEAANGKVVANSQDLDELLSMNNWPRGGKELTLKVTDAQRGDERTLTFAPKTIGLHPTQVYESISMFLLFWMLLAYFPLRARDGQVMALLMMCYGVHRYLNELLRNDPRPKGFESYASVVLVVLGASIFVWLYSRPARVKAT